MCLARSEVMPRRVPGVWRIRMRPGLEPGEQGGSVMDHRRMEGTGSEVCRCNPFVERLDLECHGGGGSSRGFHVLPPRFRAEGWTRVASDEIRGGMEAACWIRRRHGIILSSRGHYRCEIRARTRDSGWAGGLRSEPDIGHEKIR